jgi:hypothetical protein
VPQKILLNLVDAKASNYIFFDELLNLHRLYSTEWEDGFEQILLKGNLWNDEVVAFLRYYQALPLRD